MKIGIIVYSETGHTLETANRLQTNLIEQGHATFIERIAADASAPGQLPSLIHAPSIAPFDALVFAGHVQAFALAPAMRAYLDQIEPLRGKRVVGLLTQHFKHAWLGGNRATKQMLQAVANKGGVWVGSGIVHWSAKDREAQIASVCAALAASIGKA
jgi:hypothetical protein